MLSIPSINPMVRAIVVIGAVAALVAGSTFAALTSTATLTGNTISSATAELLVNNTDNGGSPATTDTGYDFSGIVPGAPYGTPHNFTLFNDGDVDMTVTVYATSGTPTGTIDKNKVHFRFDNTDSPGDDAEYTLAELEALARDVPGASAGFTDTSLAASEEDHLTVQVKMDSDAVTGSGASIGSFDLVFTGTQTP